MQVKFLAVTKGSLLEVVLMIALVCACVCVILESMVPRLIDDTACSDRH